MEELNAEAFARRVTVDNETICVAFYSSWSGASKALLPCYDNLETQMHGQAVQFARLDVDQYPVLALGHRISAVPTMVVYHMGKPAGRTTGFSGPARMRDWLGRRLRAIYELGLEVDDVAAADVAVGA